MHIAAKGNRMRRVTQRVLRFLRLLVRQRYLFLLIVPSLVFLVLFDYTPMYGASIAFKNYNPLFGIDGSPWVGLEHFKTLFTNQFFWRALRNTVLLNLYSIVFGFPAPILFALLLNEIRSSAARRAFQTITSIPHFLSWIIVGGFVVTLLSPVKGMAAYFAALFNFKYDTVLLSEQRYFRSILVISQIWKEMGYGSIIYLAAITGVDLELYDAAAVDGASKLKRMLHITLPCIIPTIVAMFILRMGSIMSSSFEQVYTLYSPNVYAVGDVISTYVYREGLSGGKFSYTTAVGLFQSVVGFFFIVTANMISRRFDNSLW